MNEFFFENAGRVIDCPLYNKVIPSDSEEADNFVEEICFNCDYLINEGVDEEGTTYFQCTYQGV